MRKFHEFAEESGRSYQEYTFVVKDVEVLVKETGDYVVITPRGTETPSFKEKGFVTGMKRFFSKGGMKDMARDVRAVPWKDKDCGWTHSGFLKGANAVLPLVDDAIRMIGKPVVFNGHSLGASIALILAIKLQKRYKVVQWIGFGCPNTFWRWHSKKREINFAMSAFRYGSDYITLIPRKIFGYTLPVRRQQLGKPAEGFLPSLEDHGIDLYAVELFNMGI